jgi:uncharacterized DUF497 family protein
MEVEFDPAKDAANLAKHGLSLADAVAFDFDGSFAEVDSRYAYGEVRFRAFGRIGELGYCLAFTINGTVMRPISFRRAHEKEMRRYGK